MSQKRIALITGASGQDASFLAELLLAKGYDVFGTLRRQSVAENQDVRVAHLVPDFKLEYADVADVSSLQRVFTLARPDEVYHLAAMSHVRVSFDVPMFTAQVNALGTLNVLDTCRQISPNARFYFAASSELFGASVDSDGYQRETTHMDPTSPYGVSKLFGYAMTRHYRRAYRMFASCGILFNHASARRGTNFVEQKICKTAVQIKRGLVDHLTLGNIDASRDWGHSKDYVRAMHAILNHERPDDFVIATGETHTVRDVVHYVFGKLGLDTERQLRFDPRYLRAEELPYLRGDATKARQTLGWRPSYTFETLLDEMLEHWLKEIPG